MSSLPRYFTFRKQAATTNVSTVMSTPRNSGKSVVLPFKSSQSNKRLIITNFQRKQPKIQPYLEPPTIIKLSDTLSNQRKITQHLELFDDISDTLNLYLCIFLNSENALKIECLKIQRI